MIDATRQSPRKSFMIDAARHVGKEFPTDIETVTLLVAVIHVGIHRGKEFSTMMEATTLFVVASEKPNQLTLTPKIRRRNTMKEALETVPGEKRSWNGLVGDIHRGLIPNGNRRNLPSNSPFPIFSIYE
jgi:hypothetical protein